MHETTDYLVIGTLTSWFSAATAVPFGRLLPSPTLSRQVPSSIAVLKSGPKLFVLWSSDVVLTQMSTTNCLL